MKLICAEPCERLDIFITQETDMTRSHIKSLMTKGCIAVNGTFVKAGAKVKAGDSIEINLPKPAEFAPENIPLDIVYEDDNLAVINKQRGLVVHPGAGNPSGTLVNALMYRFKNLSSFGERAGIVHRLDKDTTGLMVIAKNDKAHAFLAEQIAARTTVKKYRAITDGIIKPDRGRIESLIDRDPKYRTRMAVSYGSGRQAITDYAVIEKFTKNCYVEFELITGRTHQIRVHAQYKNCPILGDEVYGRKSEFKTKGQLLHSYYLEFTDLAGERKSFTQTEPQDFLTVLNSLRKCC